VHVGLYTLRIDRRRTSRDADVHSGPFYLKLGSRRGGKL